MYYSVHTIFCDKNANVIYYYNTVTLDEGTNMRHTAALTCYFRAVERHVVQQVLCRKVLAGVLIFLRGENLGRKVQPIKT